MLIYISVVTAALLFSACNRQRNDADLMHLNKIDSLLTIQPEAAAESLKQLHPVKLSHYNRGYYQLLKVIALDKTYYNFTSDSFINATVHILTRHKQMYPRTYARSLMYQGLVRYRMGVTDSTAYEPIKEAADLLEMKKIKDPLLLYFCYHYLGLIHNENNNSSYSIKYYEKAIKEIKEYGDKNYLFNTYTEITWAYLKINENYIAKQYIDTLNNFKNISDTQQANINQILSIYYECTNEFQKALEINKKILRSNNNYKDLSRMLFKISENYQALNKLDSALLYAEKAEMCKQDSSYYLNYFYYKNIGEISEQLRLWQKSAAAYKKAYLLKEKATTKELDKQVMSLEKKYDLNEAENKALLYRNSNILITIIAVFLMVLLVTLLIIWKQRNKQLHLKQLLNEQKTMALEKNNQLLKERQQRLQMEKERTDQQIIEQQFLLPLYEQITTRNTQIRKFLYDLTFDTHISKMPFLHEKVKSEFKLFDKASHAKNFESLTDEYFSKITHFTEEELRSLNKSEKLLMSLLVMKVPHQQISVLLNTTSESLSTRKLKLKKKMELNDMKMDDI
ncbi:MAG TPA: hypothetical protein PKH58_07575 [Paludibacteraceae bacterium]|nr:hypothetical protein [Paludibacteraceae bacterium]HPT43392.1 hypothetical protein [Paludibacteraceae bacterium]